MLFVDRKHAGELLAWHLRAMQAAGPASLVLGLPRGGVPVAAQVAQRLGATLDVWMARKPNAPGPEELLRSERLYRGEREPLRVAGREVVLVDDGVVTGATMRAAVEALRKRCPARIVVAVPLAPRQACRQLETVADRVVCLAAPAPFRSLMHWYQDFRPTTDEEVRLAMERSGASIAA